MNAIVEKAQTLPTQPIEQQANDGFMSPFVQRMLDRMPAEATPEFLDKLLDTQAKHEAMQALKAYNDAMTRFRSDLKPAKKTGKNAHLRTTYATFDDMLAAASGPLGSNGFNIEFKQKQEEANTITITARVTHSMGHSEETSLTTGIEEQKGINSLQALGLTVSYLKRYTMAALLGLSTEDDDGHSNSEPSQPTPPPASYTESQLQAFNRAIEKQDGFALKELAAVVGKDIWIALFNSGGKGKTVQLKDTVRKLMSEAQEIIEASHQELINRMNEEDEMGAKEILEETDWHYIAPLADTTLTNWIEGIQA